MGTRRYTIKELPPELRPRERLLEEGPEALSSAELLGILFGIGNREKTAVELASEVISRNGDLFGLHRVSVQFPKHKEWWIAVPGACHRNWRRAATTVGILNREGTRVRRLLCSSVAGALGG